MSKKLEELKTVMLVCHKCGWSFSSRRDSCPMCGAEIVINAKELARILGEYIERQGFWSSRKECEKFIKKFKSKNKRLPTLEELWKSAVDYAKLQMMDEKEIKKMKEKQDMDLKAQIEKIKKKKLAEKMAKKSKAEIKPEEKESIALTPEEKERRLRELKMKREGVIGAEKEEEGYIICPNCGAKNPPGSKFCSEDGTPLT
ncbi:MAG: zinc-ribbon domain-containing protein [Promethearchaeota archaeon]